MLLIQVVKSEKSINLFYDIFALFSLQQKHSTIWNFFFSEEEFWIQSYISREGEREDVYIYKDKSE